MSVVIVLIIAVVILAVWLIGFLWSLMLLMPFYAFIGVAVYFLWRMKRKQTEIAMSVEREAARQRLFNEQEMNAWRSAVEKDQRSKLKRDRILRSIDRSRDAKA